MQIWPNLDPNCLQRLSIDDDDYQAKSYEAKLGCVVQMVK